MKKDKKTGKHMMPDGHMMKDSDMKKNKGKKIVKYLADGGVPDTSGLTAKQLSEYNALTTDELKTKYLSKIASLNSLVSATKKGNSTSDTIQDTISTVSPIAGIFREAQKLGTGVGESIAEGATDKESGITDVNDYAAGKTISQQFDPLGNFFNSIEKKKNWKDILKEDTNPIGAYYGFKKEAKKKNEEANMSLADKYSVIQESKAFKKGGAISKKKAAEILHDGTVHGEKLTDRQRRFMGYMSEHGKEKGGEIEGKGSGTSDSISAKLGSKDFVVPAKNYEKAKELGMKYLGHKEDQMATLKAGGVPVKVSDGEYLFKAPEVRKLILLGLADDLNKLAPEAETKIKKGAGLAKGSGNPLTFVGKNGKTFTIDPENAGTQTVYEKQDVNGTTYLIGYNVDSKTGKKTIVDIRDENGLLYSDVTVGKGGTIKSIDTPTGKTDAWTPTTKTKYANITDYTPTAADDTVPVREYTTPIYNKTSGILTMPDGSKRNKQGLLWVEPSGADIKAGRTQGTWMDDGEADTYKTQFKENDYYKNAEQTYTNLENADAISKGLKDVDETTTTSKNAAQAILDSQAQKSSNTASTIGTIAGIAQAGLGAAALISDGKAPEYEVDPNMIANAQRARTAAAFGLEGVDMDLATTSIEARRRMAAQNIVNYSRGSGSTALANIQKSTNVANDATNRLASYDTAAKLTKEQYADTLDAKLAAMRRQKYLDRMALWTQNQKAGADLLQAGIENVIGAQKYKAQLDAIKARALSGDLTEDDFTYSTLGGK